MQFPSVCLSEGERVTFERQAQSLEKVQVPMRL